MSGAFCREIHSPTKSLSELNPRLSRGYRAWLWSIVGWNCREMLGTHVALVCPLASFPGGDRGCLQLLPGLSDWEAIPGSRESISWP